MYLGGLEEDWRRTVEKSFRKCCITNTRAVQKETELI